MLVDDGLKVKSYDIHIFDQHGIIMLMNGVLYLKHGEGAPLISSLTPRLGLTNNARYVGIIAFEYYCPNICMSASMLEEYHQCKGQYTKKQGGEECHVWQ